jgi:predicted O-methyltransferase YrrM
LHPWIKRKIFRAYRWGTRLGVHVLPVHYYSALPSVLELERTKKRWARASELPGIDADVDAQLERLRKVVEPRYDEHAYERAALYSGIRGLGEIEGLVLDAIVRELQPSRVIEVGSGTSSFLIAGALAANGKGALTCIEPDPPPSLLGLQARLLDVPVQDIPIETFMSLAPGDLLFIDSSHAVKPGGDVNYLLLEILPRLRPGVIVHLHDINLPFDYQPDILQTFLIWTEVSLLRALLTHNERLRIMFSLSMLHYQRPEGLRAVVPRFRPEKQDDGLRADLRSAHPGHAPSSIYLEVMSP